MLLKAYYIRTYVCMYARPQHYVSALRYRDKKYGPCSQSTCNTYGSCLNDSVIMGLSSIHVSVVLAKVNLVITSIAMASPHFIAIPGTIQPWLLSKMQRKLWPKPLVFHIQNQTHRGSRSKTILHLSAEFLRVHASCFYYVLMDKSWMIGRGALHFSYLYA